MTTPPDEPAAEPASRAAVVGILVGGQGRRMGGFPKGKLEVDGTPLVRRVVDASRQAGLEVFGVELEVVLVGDSEAYPMEGVVRIADEPAGVGPLGGLRALLRHASARGRPVVALAVDLPYVSAPVIARLLREQPGLAAFAPRSADRWEPLFARYQSAVVLEVVESLVEAGRRSLQRVFHELGSAAGELSLSQPERRSLVDWDCPEDMPDGGFPKPDER